MYTRFSVSDASLTERFTLTFADDKVYTDEDQVARHDNTLEKVRDLASMMIGSEVDLRI